MGCLGNKLVLPFHALTNSFTSFTLSTPSSSILSNIHTSIIGLVHGLLLPSVKIHSFSQPTEKVEAIRILSLLVRNGRNLNYTQFFWGSLAHSLQPV